VTSTKTLKPQTPKSIERFEERPELASNEKVVKDPTCGVPVDMEKTQFKVKRWGKEYYFCSHYCMRSFLENPRVAYFSMEIAVKSEIPTYSGGLGVLAGDTLRSSADLKIPVVAVTLVSHKGYLKQKITVDGQQLESPEDWNPSEFMSPLPNSVDIEIAGRKVKVKGWIYDHESVTGGVVPIIFLDTDVEENSPDDRSITDFLYGGDDEYRLKQEMVLGIGGYKMLHALGVNLKKFHMNEGHSSLLTLELLKSNELDEDKVKDLCVFTTHTPVAAAFDKFSYDLVQRLLGHELPLETLKKYGGQDRLNMTLLALNLSKFTNGVTEAHMEYSQKLFPGYHIYEVTNGVHSQTWTCESFKEIFHKYIRGWTNEPQLLVRADEIPDEEIWNAHIEAKRELIDFVKNKNGVQLDEQTLTLGFARRATAYKRAALIFSDMDRLRRVLRSGDLQMVFAGKAHPKDIEGKRLIQEIYDYISQLRGQVKIVYLENYNMNMAAKLTSGVDVWLNTPLPPMEASGTSGMKAAHNGVLNFSVLDGWWVEGVIEGVTGWSIGPHHDEPVGDDERRRREIEDLYGKLQYLILPTFYADEDHWIDMMKKSIGKIANYFNSHRMMRRYVTEAYL
jgi:glycogen phosphorylase